MNSQFVVFFKSFNDLIEFADVVEVHDFLGFVMQSPFLCHHIVCFVLLCLICWHLQCTVLAIFL